MFFRGSLSRSGGGLSFAFVTGFVAKSQAPPLLLGLRASLNRPNQRETIAMGDCYILCGRSGVPGPLRRRIVSDAIRSCCRMKEGSSISVSFWLRMPWPRGCWLSVAKRFVLCPLGSVHSCCRSVSSLWKTCRHPGGRVWRWRSRSSLRGYCLGAVILWFLAAFHQFCVVAERALGCTGPARLDISMLTTWRLVLGPCFLIRRLPMGWPGWGFGYVSHFEMLSVLFSGNIGFHFFRISRSFLGYVWFFLFLSS